MALTYTQAKSNLDKIADTSEQARVDLLEVTASLDRVINRLNILESQYTTFVTEVDDTVVLNPEDIVWESVQAEKDKLVSDFVTLRTLANSMKTALEGIGT